MTDEERDIITHFLERVSGAARPAAAGSVPATTAPLPPVDPQADQLIGQLFTRYPEARYRLTQTAFVQEHALVEAQSRIAQLQNELQQTRAGQPTQTAQPSGGGFFHNLFGGGGGQTQNRPGPQPQPYQPYPQPAYQPQYAARPGMFQRQGSGFLGSALTTAAGVAGGMVAGNALMNLFEGSRGGIGGGFGGGMGGGGPWDGGGGADPQVSGSAWDNQTESGPAAGWDTGGNTGDQGGGWDAGDGGDAGGGDGGGGWDSGGGGDAGGGF